MNFSGRTIRAVLFDFYDTLAYLDTQKSEPLRRQAAETLGLALEVYSEAWERRIDAFMTGKFRSAGELVRQVLADLGREAPPEVVARAVRLEELARRRAVRPYPGAKAVLSILRRRGYRLGLVSNVSPPAAQPIDRLGFRERFDVVVLSCEVGLLKPDPAIFQLALKGLGVGPTEAAFVADGGFGELDAAAALGMFTVRVSLPHQRPDYGSSRYWDREVKELRQLLDLFPGLHSRSQDPSPPAPRR